MRHRRSDAGGSKPSLAACSSACAVTDDLSHLFLGATILAGKEADEQECPMAAAAMRRRTMERAAREGGGEREDETESELTSRTPLPL